MYDSNLLSSFCSHISMVPVATLLRQTFFIFELCVMSKIASIHRVIQRVIIAQTIKFKNIQHLNATACMRIINGRVEFNFVALDVGIMHMSKLYDRVQALT